MNSPFNLSSTINSLIFLIPIVVLIFYFLLRKKKITDSENEESETVLFFTGNKSEIAYLRGILDENGISSFLKNDFHSGAIAGFSGGLPTLIDLYILQADVAKAEPILKDFNISSS